MRIRFFYIYHTCAFLLFFAHTTHAALKTDTWIGGTGIWNNASNWSLNVVPHNNNGSNDQYVVDIDGGNLAASAVVIDQSLNPTVNAVVLDANDSLTITNGMTLTLTNGATFNGTVTLAAANNTVTLQFIGPATLGGTGEVVFGGLFPFNDRLYTPSGTLTIGPGITIHGAGGQLLGSPSGPVINQGTIYTDTSNLTMNLNYVINQGQLIASNGGNFYLSPFTNSGTVSVTGGTLTLDTSWSNSGVISGNVSFIELNGNFTTPGGSFVNVGSTININGTMLNTANTFALTATTGSWYLNGTISGGTITASGGAQLIGDNGVLDGVTVNGPLNVTNGATLSVTSNGLTLNSTLTLASANNGANLQFNGVSTLGGTGLVVYGGLIPNNDRILAPSGTLTIGSGISIHGAGGVLQGSPNGPVINQGTIYTDTSNLTMNLDNVINQGQIIASNGSDLNLSAFSNNGTVSVTGGTLTLASSWSNSGVISGNDSIINLNGTFTTPSGSIINDGSTITINGTMLNTANTLALTATTGSWYLNGTISGGTITASDGAQLIVNSGALDGVALDTPLTVTNGATLSVTTNGLILNSTITLAAANNGANLQFNGVSTLGGTGEVVYGGLFPNNDRVFAPSGTLTIGSGITIYGAGGQLQGSPTGPVINQGTIYTDTSNLTMNLQNVINQGQLIASNGSDLALNAFSNSGTISMTGGTLTLDGSWSNSGVISANVSFIELNGTFITPGGSIVNNGSTITINGTMVNTNNTLALTADTGSWYLNGTISGGTITASDGAQLIMDSGALDGVTLNAPLTVPTGASLTVTTNGLTLNSTITVAFNPFGSLQFNGPTTLDGTGEVVFAGPSPVNDSIKTASGTLTIGSGITIQGAGGQLQGSALAPVINQGTIYTDASGQTMNLYYVINQGQLIASNGSDLYLNTLSNNGTVGVTGGTLTLDSLGSNSGVISGSNSIINFVGTYTTPGGNIVNNGSTITINGTMINTGNTLALTAATGSWYLNGTISGGSITASGGAQLIAENGILDGVTLNAPLLVPQGANLNVTTNGLVLNSTLTLAFNPFGSLQFNGPTTLGGTGQVVFAGPSPASDSIKTASGTLTIGLGITIHGAGGQLQGSPLAPMINQGTIYTDASGQTMNLSYVINQGQLIASNGSDLNLNPFSNQGQLLAIDGSTLFVYYLTNSGVVSIDNTSTLQFTGDYVQIGGSTVLDGGQFVPITGGSMLVEGGDLSGGAFLNMVVTNFGTINPSPAVSALVFASNLVLQSSSVLDFQVGGYTPVSQYGYVVLSNGVNLAGSLAVTLINGFVPALGSSLTIATSSAPITGSFTNVVSGFRIQTTDGAGSFVYSQTPNSIVLYDFQINPQPYLTWAQSYFGCTNCPQSSELADPAGDGMNNLAKFLAGFNPTNSTAFPHIIGIARINSNMDICVTYLAANGDSSLESGMQSCTNVLEYSTGEADGSYSTTSFVSTGQTNILSGGNGMGIVTNMVDPGGATNQPARYYRIKIITP